MGDAWRDRDEMERERRRMNLFAAQTEFVDLAALARTGDMILRISTATHWTLTRSRGAMVVAQFWPSVEKLQLQGEGKSRSCTLAQFRATLRDKFGCASEKSK